MTQDLNHLRYQIPHGHDPRLMRGPGGPKKVCLKEYAKRRKKAAPAVAVTRLDKS